MHFRPIIPRQLEVFGAGSNLWMFWTLSWWHSIRGFPQIVTQASLGDRGRLPEKCRFDHAHFICDSAPMTATLEEITRTALQLPVRQRLALAGFLLETQDISSDTGVDAAWDQEIQDRIKAVDGGAVTGISYQDVMLDAEKRLAP